jgi:hypothetical protein
MHHPGPGDELEALRARLPLLRRLEAHGYVQFRADGVHTLRDIEDDELLAIAWRALLDEFAVADEHSPRA